MLIQILWTDYFIYKITDLHWKWKETLEIIHHYFFTSQWYEVCDFIEFIANLDSADYEVTRIRFMDLCDEYLERELSGYRFVSDQIVPITSEEEISSIEKALEDTTKLKAVNTHLHTALGLFADRKAPDYRNSIKESISAVEAICGMIAGKPTSLGNALREIERKTKIQIHTALKKSFDSLYGYASNADGIRHALLDEPNLDSEDAKFMLVSCSAFINYLITKASKAGIKL